MPWQHQPHLLPDRCWVEVDLHAISANAQRFCVLMGGRRLVIPAVKADGYGHGAVAVSRAALAGGAARLGVASVPEGVELRTAGILAPLHILGLLCRDEIEAVLECDLIPSLYDEDSFRLLSLAALRSRKTVAVHLKIDTGMGRHGCFPEEAVALGVKAAALPAIYLEGVFTHLAQASDEVYTRFQLATFDKVCAALTRAGVAFALRHASGTTAAVLYPESRYDAIRPGLGIYGIAENAAVKAKLRLDPALTWKTRVVQLKDYPPGQAVGYNRTFATQAPTRAALLPVGYADGYRRTFSNRADVLIRGIRCRVLGMVSMDWTVVDVTHVPGTTVGDEVTLVGRDGAERITVEELASFTPGAIPYEIITGFGPRNRWYYREGEVAVRAA